MSHILACAAIQRFLHDRLLGTPDASEGGLQGRIGSQTGVDFYQPMGSGQQADKGIIQLVNRRVLDRLLGDLHRLSDRAKQVQLLQLHAQGRQTRTPGKLLRRFPCQVIAFLTAGIVNPDCELAVSSLFLLTP